MIDKINIALEDFFEIAHNVYERRRSAATRLRSAENKISQAKIDGNPFNADLYGIDHACEEDFWKANQVVRKHQLMCGAFAGAALAIAAIIGGVADHELTNHGPHAPCEQKAAQTTPLKPQ